MTYFTKTEKRNYYIRRTDEGEVFLCRYNGKSEDLCVSLTEMYGFGNEPSDVETVLTHLSTRTDELWGNLPVEVEEQPN